MINIEKILGKYYSNDEKIILACSTWPDSMFLLYQILETKYRDNLVVCYFNHKLRNEADREEKFIESMWKEKWFIVEVAECRVKEIRDKFYPSKWLEEVAREKRYAFLNAVLNIYSADKIMTWHHLDDKIETFFFNLARGSKLSGLINMKEQSWQIIRPLINIEKTDILEYLDNNNLEYKIDETNFDTDITRNKLRHDIVPQFESVNWNYKNNINNLISYLEEVKENIDFQVEDFLKEQWIKISNNKKYKDLLWNNFSPARGRCLKDRGGYGYFYIKDFNYLTTLIQKEVIRYIFYISNWKSTIWLSEANIAEVIKFINWKNNKTIKEIKEMRMKKENEIIIF